MVALPDLPTEVLLRISAIIQSDPSARTALLYLAQSCKRLNFVVTPALLSSMGLPIGRTIEVTLTRHSVLSDFDALSVLITAFELSTIPRLICHFESSQLSHIAYQCFRLYLLIARLDSLEELDLYFDDDDTLSIGPVAEELQTWSDIFGSLLNVVLRKGCKKLCLRGGVSISEANPPASPGFDLRHWFLGSMTLVRGLWADGTGADPSPASGLRNVFPNSNAVLPRHLRSPYIPPQSFFSKLRLKAPNHSLTSIEIGLRTLLQPSFSQWLYQAFRSSPNLTSLAIRGVDMDSSLDWDPAIRIILNSIPASRPLTSLTLAQLTPTLGSSSLLNLLNNLDFSQLTHLHLDDSLPMFNPSESRVRIGRLPRIKFIQAPSDYWLYLIDKFTHLETARVMTRLSASTSLKNTSCVRRYGPIFEHLVSIRCPSIGLMLNHLPIERNTGFLDATKVLAVDLEGTIQTTLARFIQREEMARSGALKVYESITDLALCPFSQWVEQLKFVVIAPDGTLQVKEDVILPVVSWLAGFGNLRRVEFRSEDLEHRGCVMLAADKFAELVGRHRRTMESVRIGEKLYQFGAGV
ncbi:hypothetical protein AX16_002740 [Volvariella volvacea WC 439]|nr:hypothetical protein AX16_002740 [Volvariella volvacea WC 439]